jgi:hypothetical protein
MKMVQMVPLIFNTRHFSLNVHVLVGSLLHVRGLVHSMNVARECHRTLCALAECTNLHAMVVI